MYADWSRVTAAAVLERCSERRVEAGAARQSDGLREPALGERVLLRRGVREVAEQPSHPQRALVLERRGGLEDPAPRAGVDAVPAQAGVELDLDGGARCGGRDPFDLLERRHPEVDARGGDGAEVGVGVQDPGEQRCVDPGAAQRERLLRVRDAEPGRAARERGPRRGHGAVAVAVRLHDREELRRPRELAQRPGRCARSRRVDAGATDRRGDRARRRQRVPRSTPGGNGATPSQPSSTTNAEAMPASWLRDRCVDVTPSSSSRAATSPGGDEPGPS